MSTLKVKFLMGPSDCNDENIPSYSENFLKELSDALGISVICAEMDEIVHEALPVFFIASGGAEEGFKASYYLTDEPYVLLTTPSYNSLAAAMEIMGFLQEHNLKGEILHGSISRIASRLKVLLQVSDAKKSLAKKRIGCFGEAGGLIASDVDPKRLKDAIGTTMIQYQLSELIDEYKKGGYIKNQYTEELIKKGFNREETEKALNVYGALKRLIEKHDLDAVTVKCFDLLDTIYTTGCLALAILNAEKIPAACEGDQKSLLSMTILQAITGESGFMANPCYIDPDTNEVTFAHCTIPIDIPDQYALTTHFESGIGVAITSDLEKQKMTIFKCDDSLYRYYADTADLVETMHHSDLCRSQMRLKVEGGIDYFLMEPISNHHIICKGDWKEAIDEFFA